MNMTAGFFSRVAMAMHNEDVARIRDSHDPGGKNLVAYAPHVSQEEPTPEYKAIVDSRTPGSRKKLTGIEGGSRPKATYADPDGNIYMTKPYFPVVPPGQRGWYRNPLGGWATMTNKAIYDAAELNSINENVITHNLEGDLPTTVHKFEKGYSSVMSLIDSAALNSSPLTRTVEPLKIQQVAILDYLTGNTDRTPVNLLVSDAPNDSGHHDLLAIDHEAAFQYNMKRKESPETYFSLPLKRLSFGSYAGDQALTAKWWQGVRDPILNAFTKNEEIIRHAQLREHIRKNFLARIDVLDKWADSQVSGDSESPVDLFSQQFPYPVKTKPIDMDTTQSGELISMLPDNPTDAVMKLAVAYGTRPVAVQRKLLPTLNQLISTSELSELIETYKRAKSVNNILIGGVELSQYITYQIVRERLVSLAEGFLDHDDHVEPGFLSPLARRELNKI